jgi:hypothetical protein
MYACDICYVFICLQQREVLQLQEAYTIKYKIYMLHWKKKNKSRILNFSIQYVYNNVNIIFLYIK